MHSPWRKDFPALAALSREQQVYLDSAATSQKPQAMLDALLGSYALGAANVHRAQHLPGERATRAYENSRQTIATWLNAGAGQIIFTRGATEAFNLLAYGLEAQIQAGDEIVISALEHHANLLPWQQLAQRRQARLVILPLTTSGHIDLEQASQLIGPCARIVAVSQLSNVLGTLQPVQQLIQLAKAQGALTVIDGAQGVVHQRPDLEQLGCDFYVFSSHKLYGPDGLGVLYAHPAALPKLKHWQFGGEMVLHTDYHHSQFQPAPLGFEAGTPPISSAIAFAASLNYLSAQDPLAIAQHEQALHHALLAGLNSRPTIQLLGQADCALASFNVQGVHPADLASLLAEQGIAVRGGTHCAQPLYQSLGLSGALRVSLALYNDGDDLQRFFNALDQALELLQ